MTQLPSASLAVEDAEAIRALIIEFHYLIDSGRAEQCLELLTADATLVFGPGSPKPDTIEGEAAIGDFLRVRQAAPVTTRHLLGPARLVAHGADEVAASSLITLFKSPGGQAPEIPAAIADLEERYVRTSLGWRLAYREVRPVVWS